MTIDDQDYTIPKKFHDRKMAEQYKEKSIPIKLTSVKTLNEWFANLPLIQKIDHYNSHIRIIANNLK